jgi:hypothetical protein
MKKNVVATQRYGKPECIVGVLTTLVLVGILAVLTTEFCSFAGAFWDSTERASESRPPEKPKVQRIERVAQKSVRPAGERKNLENHAEAQEPPAGPATWVPAGGVAEGPRHDFLGNPLVAMTSLFASAVVAALVFVHGFFILLRRHTQRLGPLIHIEYKGAPAMVVGPFTASSVGAAGAVPQAGSERQDRFAQTQAEVGGAPTAQRFDMGPTFEEQHRLKDEQAKRQEGGVLEQLFEDNLKLHGQISLAKEKQGALLQEADI